MMAYYRMFPAERVLPILREERGSNRVAHVQVALCLALEHSEERAVSISVNFTGTGGYYATGFVVE
jgi:hypothetical protein